MNDEDLDRERDQAIRDAAHAAAVAQAVDCAEYWGCDPEIVRRIRALVGKQNSGYGTPAATV